MYVGLPKFEPSGYYYNEHVRTFVRDLCEEKISQGGLYQDVSLNNVPEDKIHEFVRLMIDWHEEPFHIIDPSLMQQKLRIMLKTGDDEDKVIFADVVMQCMTDMYYDVMESILKEEFELMVYERKNDPEYDSGL